MKTKIYSLLLALLISIGATAQTPWDGSNDTSWYDDHSGSDSYEISTAAELAGLARLTTHGVESFAGKTITLTDDIDLAGKPWRPMSFKGTFDGGGFTISGMNTNISNGAGLFAVLIRAVVKNLNVEGSANVTTGNLICCGGIAASAENSTIQNCSFVGSVSAAAGSTGYCGGIVGNSNSTILLNNYARGMVTITSGTEQSAGGITGWHGGNASYPIQNNYFEGEITVASGTNKGGIVGENASSSASISNNYYQTTGGEAAIGRGTASSDNIKNNTAFTGKPGTFSSAVSVGGDSYDTLLSALNAWVEAQITPNNYLTWEIVAGKNSGYPMLPVSGNGGNDPDPDPEYWIDYADNTWDYSGSDLTIDSPEKLARLAELVNDGTELFVGKTITLTDNIDLDEKIWIPIGNDSNDSKSFRGTFDGAGFTISGMNVDIRDDAEDGGLFGTLEKAMVKNLNVEGSVGLISTSDYSFCGGIAAYAINSTIQNCSFVGTVSSGSNNYAYCAGIVGVSDSSNFSNNYARGTLTITSGAEQYGGGIIGYCDGFTSSIQNNYFQGKIALGNGAEVYKGGIVGWNHSISASISNNYYQTTGGEAMIGTGEISGNNIKNNAAFTGKPGTFSSAVSVGNDSYNTLFDVLNAWVGVQDTPSDYLTWEVIFGTNDGYPIFGDFGDDPQSESWIDYADNSWDYSGSDLTIDSPEKLARLAELVNEGIELFVDKTITLTDNIDLDKKIWMPIGNDYNNDKCFWGTFDGAGFTISGMQVDESVNSGGLFGSITGAMVKNLNVTGSVDGDFFHSGGIAGEATGSTIQNCSFVGSINGTNNYAYCGGILGYSYHSELFNNYACGTITSYNLTINSVEYGKVISETGGLLFAEGDEVSLSVIPNQDCKLVAISAHQTGNTGVVVPLTKQSETSYSFRMPGYDVTVQASFEKSNNIYAPNAIPLYAITTREGFLVRGLIPGELFSVATVHGLLVYRGVATATEQTLMVNGKGMYIIKCGNRSVKARREF